jgi:hypothetical protein
VDLDARMLDKFPLDQGKGLKEDAKVSISPFVILHHTGHISQDRGDHWDWLIRFPDYFLAELAPRVQASKEAQIQGLLAFASENHPRDWSSGCQFWRLSPHRLDYLQYQGAVSNGRGNVKRIAFGELQWIFLSDFQLQFRLFRLGYLDDSQHSSRARPWFAEDPSLGASANGAMGQYSLTFDRDNTDLIRLPWMSCEPDPGKYWRIS